MHTSSMCDNRDRNSKPSLLLQNFKAETFSRVRVKTQVEVEVKIHGALLFVKITEENTMGTAKPIGISLVE